MAAREGCDSRRRAGRDLRAVQDGTIVGNRGALFEVLVDGQVVRCVLRGRLKHVKKGEHRQAATPISAGDRVKVTLLEPGRGVIEEVLSRATGLCRAAAGGVPLQQTLVANAEQAVIVFAVVEPRPDLFLLDRLIVAAIASRLVPLVVVNKCDLLVDGESAPGGFAVYRQCFRVLFTSAETRAGLDELRAALTDRRSVMCGPSGVGKSSLLNAIAPGLNLRVGEVGGVTHKGRHTTTGITLLQLPFGGWVADTAGLRQFGFREVAPDQIAAAFPDLQPHLGRCRFADCSHRREQGCAIGEAVRSGQADARRVRSYLQLIGGST